MTKDHLSKITSDALAIDLIEFKRIVLPSRIDESALALFANLATYAWTHLPGERIELWCAGNGGQADETRAICDLIREHGHFDGILAGVAYSAHSIIWAACDRRYVYPSAQLGVHRTVYTYSEPTQFTASQFELMWKTAQAADLFMVETYALASDKDVDWWMEKAYDGELTTRLSASELIAIGMAQPIVELGAPVIADSSNGKTP